jgi:hypothetical protein
MENKGNVLTHKIVDSFLYFIWAEKSNNGGNQCLVMMDLV